MGLRSLPSPTPTAQGLELQTQTLCQLPRADRNGLLKVRENPGPWRGLSQASACSPAPPLTFSAALSLPLLPHLSSTSSPPCSLPSSFPSHLWPPLVSRASSSVLWSPLLPALVAGLSGLTTDHPALLCAGWPCYFCLLPFSVSPYPGLLPFHTASSARSLLTVLASFIIFLSSVLYRSLLNIPPRPLVSPPETRNPGQQALRGHQGKASRR